MYIITELLIYQQQQYFKSMNYLKVIKEDDQYIFERDIQLKFDPSKHPKIGYLPRGKGLISRNEIIDSNKLINLDPVSVYDIPPTLLFVAINNVYSYPMSLFIPLDMNLDVFSNNVAKHIFNKKQSSNFTGFHYIDWDNLGNGYIDTVKWNDKAIKEGRIWFIDDTVLLTVQSVIKLAKTFHNEIL